MVITANASTLFARLLAGAITLMFFTYAFVNMGMVSGILPVVGVPLPLVSYGGTALVSLFIGARHPDERAGASQAHQYLCPVPQIRSQVRGEIGRHPALVGLTVPIGTLSAPALSDGRFHPLLCFGICGTGH